MSKDKENKGKMSMGIKIIIILLSVIIIAGAGFAGYYFLAGNNKDKVEVKHPLEDEKTFSLEEFKLNLADENGSTYIQTTIYVGYKKNSKLEAELEEKKPIMRDTINKVMRGKKSSDLSVKGTEELKELLIKSINPLLEKGKIDNIYYDKFIMQKY